MFSESVTSMGVPVISMIGMPGPMELIVVGLIILLLFGKRLPDLMGSLGRSIVEFKKGAREGEEEDVREPEPSKNLDA